MAASMYRIAMGGRFVPLEAQRRLIEKYGMNYEKGAQDMGVYERIII